MGKLCCDKAVLTSKNKLVDGIFRDTYVCKHCSKVIYLYDETQYNEVILKKNNHSSR